MTTTTTAPEDVTMMNRVVAVAGGGMKKTILITGVSKGLGRALALEMAKSGHAIIGCSRSQDKLDSLRSELQFSDDRHLLMNLDVKLNSSVEELARIVMEKKIVPNIIVNNAGTINKNNKIWEVPVEEFDTVIDTNIKGIANVLRHFIPMMIESNQGIIVNMSSGWGRSAAAQSVINVDINSSYFFYCVGPFLIVIEQVAPYCASKWAIEGLTRSVAKELPTGMGIVALSPGVVNTDMLASCFGNSADLYPSPETWAPKAASMILNLTAADNGASLTV